MTESPAGAAEHEGGTGQAVERAPAVEALETLDAARLAELREIEVNGAPGLVAALFDAFFPQAAADVATLASAAETEDSGLVGRASHRLRGAAGTLGAERLAEAGAALEAAASAGEVSRYPALFERVRSELAVVRSTVDAWAER